MRRSRVRVARAGGTRVHLDRRLVRRRRAATPLRRPVWNRRQRPRSDHRASEDRLLVGVIHDETVRVLTPGRQARFGGGWRSLAGRSGDHRRRLRSAARQLSAELKLGRRSGVNRRRTTRLVSLLELTPVNNIRNSHRLKYIDNTHRGGLSGGPVGSAPTWAATLNEVGKTTYFVNRERVGMEAREGSDPQSHKRRGKDGWNGGKREGSTWIFAQGPEFLVTPLQTPVCLLTQDRFEDPVRP